MIRLLRAGYNIATLYFCYSICLLDVLGCSLVNLGKIEGTYICMDCALFRFWMKLALMSQLRYSVCECFCLYIEED